MSKNMIDFYNKLSTKIDNKKIKICIIGMGYVGLPLAMTFSKKNIKTLGFDIDKNKIKLLRKNKSYIGAIKDSEIKKVTSKNNFYSTSNLKDISIADIFILCVPTPLKNKNKPDLSYVSNSLNSILPYLKEGKLIVLESTTYPGTTKDIILKKIIKKGKKNIFLGYSPEREDPGNDKFNTGNIPKIVSGIDINSLKLTTKLYDHIITKTHKASNTETAEAVKIAENTFRAVNIALANELKIIFEKMNINIWEVIDLASTKPFGYMPFFPGPGLGGHCIPIDPFYLSYKAQQVGVKTKFIELAGKINTFMPKYVISNIEKLIKSKFKSKGKKIDLLIVGLSYKKNVGDIRESPSLEILNYFIKKKYNVEFYDTYFKTIPKTKKYGNIAGIKSTSIKNSGKNYDIGIILTDHDNVNYKLLRKKAKFFIDTRNVFEKNQINDKNIFLS